MCAEVCLKHALVTRYPSALLRFTIPNFSTGGREAIAPDCKSGVSRRLRRFKSFPVDSEMQEREVTVAWPIPDRHVRVQILSLLPNIYRGGLTLTGKGAVLKTAAPLMRLRVRVSHSPSKISEEAWQNWLMHYPAKVAGTACPCEFESHRLRFTFMNP